MSPLVMPSLQSADVGLEYNITRVCARGGYGTHDVHGLRVVERGGGYGGQTRSLRGFSVEGSILDAEDPAYLPETDDDFTIDF